MAKKQKPVVQLRRWWATVLPGSTGLHLHLGGRATGHPNHQKDHDIQTGKVVRYRTTSPPQFETPNTVYQLVGAASPEYLQFLRRERDNPYLPPEMRGPAGRITSASVIRRFITAVRNDQANQRRKTRAGR